LEIQTRESKSEIRISKSETISKGRRNYKKQSLNPDASAEPDSDAGFFLAPVRERPNETFVCFVPFVVNRPFLRWLQLCR
jgi:hypothetical protein